MDVIGIQFMDFSGRVVRKTEAIIEDEIYAPIVKVLPNSIYEDREFDDGCMFSFDFINNIVNQRRIAGVDIYLGE